MFCLSQRTPVLETSKFTSFFGFLFPSLTILVNWPLTLLSSIFHNLEQLVLYSWPSCMKMWPNILDLFITFSPIKFLWRYSTFFLYWVPVITIFYLHFVLSLQHLLRIPQKQRCLWCFLQEKRGSLWNLRKYCSHFPWNYYCFRVRESSLCVERLTEAIVSGMEAYIPKFHVLYTSVRNHAKCVFFSWSKPSWKENAKSL